MYKTLQTLRPLITSEFENLTLEQLAVTYQETLNPSILACVFEKTYRLFIRISEKFYGLTQEDIASFALQQLDFSLKSFDNKHTNFLAYCTTVFRNKLREETIALSQHKRCANNNCDDLTVLPQTACEEDKQLSTVEFILTLDTLGLTERERTYCDYLMQGFKSSTIANLMNISPARLSQFRNQLRKKLNCLVYETI